MLESNDDTERLLTVLEASQYLSLSRSKVYAMMDAGELVYASFGRARRIPMRAIRELIRAHLTKGSTLVEPHGAHLSIAKQ